MRIYRQRGEKTCAPRSLQTALAYYGIYPKFSDIRRKCSTDDEGTTLLNIEEAAKEFGLKIDRYNDEAVSVEVIEKHLSKDELVIVLWYTGPKEDNGHVAVAYEVDKDYIYLLDTAAHLYTEPTMCMKKHMLERCWENHLNMRWLLGLRK